MKRIIVFILFTVCFFSCKTVDLEKMNELEPASIPGVETLEEESQVNEAEMNEILLQEELKVQDVENTVVYVDRPVYIPADKSVPELEKGNETGLEAVKESQKRAVIKPEQYKYGTFYYHYSEELVYEIYAQPYHLTDICLETGEEIIADPLLSEDESVWELTSFEAVDSKTGGRVIHLTVKPAYSKLDSTLIVSTNRRVYHFRLKSFADTHMARVKFTYPVKNFYKSQLTQESRTVETDFVRVTNPEFLSFDYKIKYSIFRKPEWLPTRVYDDGQSTYIQVNDIVLQKQLPVLFNEKNEIINYTVKKNIFVVPRLIDKLTLRLGKEKVVIEKKKTKTVKEGEK